MPVPSPSRSAFVGPRPERGDEPAGLRAERDRFLGFAFAAADALIEIDGDQRIVFAAGATRALLEKDARELAGQSVLALVPEHDRARLIAAIGEALRNGRLTPIAVEFGADGRRLVVSGQVLPARPKTLYLALRLPRADAPAVADARRDRRTGLLDKSGFSALATDLLRDRPGGAAPYQMSMLETEGLSELTGRLDQRVSDELFGEIGNLLRRNSIGGDAAARFDGDKYGLVHERSLDLDGLRRTIEEVARRMDPARIGMQVVSNTMDLAAGSGSGSEADCAQALLYAINSFAERRGGVSLREMSERTQPMLVSTVERISQLRQRIARGDFGIVYQPVVSLADKSVHHYEALVRFGTEPSPYDSIIFAEQVGLIVDFDLAMTHKVLARQLASKMRGANYGIGINISGRSLENGPFLDALRKLLRSYHMLRGQVMFEITESAEIRDLQVAGAAIDALRKDGYGVCLDDFGAGASAFHYLRALHVDYVKIDGRYIRNVLSAPRDQPFLRAMVQLCRELGVATIGEMVETEETARFLNDLGVQYAQGYLFGRPAPEPVMGGKRASPAVKPAGKGS